MTNNQQPQPGRRDSVDDAVSWFTGSPDAPSAPEVAEARTDAPADGTRATGITLDGSVAASRGRADDDAPDLAARDAGVRDEVAARSVVRDDTVLGDDTVVRDDSTDWADDGAVDRVTYDTDSDGRADIVGDRAVTDDAGPDTQPYEPVDDDNRALVDTPGKPLYRDEDAVVAAPGLVGTGTAAATTTTTVGADETAVLPVEEPRTRKQDRLARDRTLGKVERVPEQPAPVPYTTPTTYKGLPSLGLFLLRLVTGALLGLRAYQHWSSFDATQQMWSTTMLPSPGMMTWITIGVEAVLALLLLFGAATRVAGLALLVYAGALLIFVDWGAVSILQPGRVGLVGEMDLLLAVLGFFFFSTGGGRWGVDGGVHSARIQRKNDRLFA